MRAMILSLLFLFAACLAALPAAAQGTGLGLGKAAEKAKSEGAKGAQAPPDAIPGAKPRPDSVTPATHGMADLPPSEALFDAINRGDIISARDAISRGADLDATNLLGLTPIELSVDLGRNDISFLLLSLRGTSSGARPTQQPAVAAATKPQTAAERRAARRALAASAPAVQKAPAQKPAVYAGNSGTPVPAAGFLGFNGR